MIKKIIYIGYQPLTSKVRKDFYFNQVLENGIELEYCDLSMIYFKNKLHDLFDDKIALKFYTLMQFESYLKYQDFSRTLFVLNINFEYRVLKLFKILTKYDCFMSFFDRPALPIDF